MDTEALVTGLVTALIANVVFATVVALTAIVVGRLFWRHRVRAFFGIRPDRGALPIYLSNIIVKPGGAIGTDTAIRGFSGSTISEVEYFYSLQFAKAVETKPLSRALKKLDPSDKIIPVEPIVCQIHISPPIGRLGDPDTEDILAVMRTQIGLRSVIVVGGPAYNALALYMLQMLSSTFSFIREEDESGLPVRGIRMHRNLEKHRDFVRRAADGSDGQVLEYFIVEKLTWPARSANASGRSRTTKVFICAGTCSAATAAALRMLAGNWRELERGSEGRDFGLLCELELSGIEQRVVHLPEEVEVHILHQYGYAGKLA
jgi:hypothetical protein